MSAFSRRRFLAATAGFAAIPLLPRLPQAADGFRTIALKEGEARLSGPEGPPTPIWGYDGTCPGPTLRLKRGEEVKVRILNGLTQPTSVHWHGVRIDNAMDGAAGLTQAPIPPGGTFDYRFKVPDAGTYWYHPHYLSSEQLERGLHGLLIVEETEPFEVDRDVALMLDDWRLDRDGRIHESFGNMHDAAHQGRYGNLLTANAIPVADVAVRTNERIRLRIVNVANARVMPVRVADHEATAIAFDGQPAEPFRPERSRVVLPPGARCDLLFDALRPAGSVSSILVDTGREEVTLARLVYAAGEPKRAAPLPPARPLPPNPLPATMDFRNALKLDIAMQGGAMSPVMAEIMRGSGDDRRAHGGGHGAMVWTLKGRASDGHTGPPLFSVKRGRTVMLGFPNETHFPHAMHVHGHHFRWLDPLDDGWKPYWLDTVLILPRKTERIAFVADNPGKWMLHCHMIEHLEAGMAAWFEVT